MTSTRAGYVVGGRYRLIAELGAGGFGRVWQARDEALDVDVAIKELRLLPGMSQAEQDERLARATREARNAARLRKHENIVAIHDVVVEDGLPWIVMELVDGCSLDQHLRAHGPLPVERAATVATALLRAIGAAHRGGIVHRDIKPGNVMLAHDGTVLLTDFGTAVHNTDTTLTATGMLIGSPEYMAPERLHGTDGLPASDLFSLGATLYQAVEGTSPFHRDSPHATLTAVLLGQAPPPHRAGSLAHLITRLLDKDPDNRPTVAEALAMATEQTTTQIHRETVAVRPVTKIITVGGREPRKWQYKGVWVLMALIFALGIGGLMVDEPGDAVGDIVDHGGILSVIALFGTAVLTGALCTGITRFLPEGAGLTVTVIVGIATFLLGGAATLFAAGSCRRILRTPILNLGSVEAGQLTLIVLPIIVLIAAGWAWESRTPRP